MREDLRTGEIVDRHDVEARILECVPEDKPADSTESVDRNRDRHHASLVPISPRRIAAFVVGCYR
jgi:hypothetical protein